MQGIDGHRNYETRRECLRPKCYTSPVDEASILLLRIGMKVADGTRLVDAFIRGSQLGVVQSPPVQLELMHASTARRLDVAFCVPCLLGCNMHAHACNLTLGTG
jgi:hypothetical protein